MIRTDYEWNTDEWAGKIRMYDPPNWYGVSPEVVAQRGKQWNQDPLDGLWLDNLSDDEAKAKIAERREQGLITEEEEDLLVQWATRGYFILEHAIEEERFELLDQYRKDLDDLWTTDKVFDGLQIMSLHIPGRRPGPIDHAELLTYPLEQRLELRDKQRWRIHYYQPYSDAAMEITKAPKMLRMSQLLLDADPVLVNAIGIKYGTQVGLHQDLGAYHIHPANHLIGLWLGAEEGNPHTGPLAVYPGSHRVPHWPGWNNYPQTNLRSCHLETRDEQARYLADEVKKRGIERKPLVVGKGSAIFQHPLLIHGAEKITDPEGTRFSMVIHYSISGGDKIDEAVGPFNW